MQRDNERFVISFLFFVTVVTIIFVYSLLLLLLSHFSHVQPHRRQPTRLPRPWGSPGKNTGVTGDVTLKDLQPSTEGTCWEGGGSSQTFPYSLSTTETP